MGLFDRFFGPPTEDQFAKIIMKMLRTVGDDRVPSYDKANFRLTFSKDGTLQGMMNLRNLYTEYCNGAKKDRKALLLRTCKGLAFPMEIPDDFEDVRPDLLPTVRTRTMTEVMRLDAEISGDTIGELAWYPLTQELIICLVYDLPSSMQFVTQERLSSWNISAYEALECARQNLEQRQSLLISVGDKLFIVESGDAYDATRLLLTERIRSLPISGAPVAMPVTRDCLLITGTDDVEGLGMMAEIAEKKQTEARPVCPIPVRMVDDEWESWLPPADHPHYEKFNRLRAQYYGSAYAEQKTQLEKRNEQLGHDVFVASLSGLERNNTLVTYALWSKGVPTWLPEAHYVALYDPDEESSAFVSWERLEQHVGHLLEQVDCHPPRWSVTEFPTAEELERLQPEVWSN